MLENIETLKEETLDLLRFLSGASKGGKKSVNFQVESNEYNSKDDIDDNANKFKKYQTEVQETILNNFNKDLLSMNKNFGQIVQYSEKLAQNNTEMHKRLEQLDTALDNLIELLEQATTVPKSRR